jgi:hypothetical protein
MHIFEANTARMEIAMNNHNQTRTFVFSVTLLIHVKSGLVWWPAEIDVPHAMDDEQALDYLNSILVEDGTLRATKIKTASGEGLARVIVGREPVLIGVNAIATITALHLNLIEEAEGGRPR